MKYMGSKARIVKEILPIMLKELKDGQWFVDLFCGGCSIIENVPGEKRIANDKNKYLVALFQGLQQESSRVTTIDKELYSAVRKEYNAGTNIEFTDFEIGWIGFMGSYNGRFFDGGYSGHSVAGRDYIKEQIKNTEKQISKINGIRFFSKEYYEFNFKEPVLIYCDIPYKGTKQYSTSKDFDHDAFWEWCREKKKQGHTIFISEYEAPEDFKCVWQKEITNSMNTKNTYKPMEKLFTL